MAVEAYVNLPTPSTPLLGQPTLSGGIDDTVTSLIVSSNANVPSAAPFRFIIGDEILYCSARPSTTWTVARGQEGSAAAAHLDGVTVVVAGVLTAASLKNNPLALTTTGDLPYLNSSGNQARLGIGSASAVLTVTAGVPAWTLTPAVTSITLSGITAGSVLFAGTAGIVSQDNANAFYDGTLHNLGLGLTAPLASLHVSRGASTYSAFTTALATTINAGAIVALAPDDTSFAGGATSLYGIESQVSINPAGNATRAVRAIDALALIPSTNAVALAGYTLTGLQAVGRYDGTGSLLTLRGANLAAQHAGAGAVTTHVGLDVTAQRTAAGTGNVATFAASRFNLVNSAATGTVTTAVGVDVLALTNAGTITDTVGIRVGDITTGTQTNTPYSIQTNDFNARILFNQAYSSFNFATGTYLLIGDANVAIHGADKNQLIVANSVVVDSVDKYGNPIFQGRLQNASATPTELILGEFGWEGNYTDSGIGTGANVPHMYVWDAVTPRFLLMSHLVAGSPTEFVDTGVAIQSLFDKSAINTSYVFTPTFTLSGTPGAKTYASLYVRPKLNVTDGASTVVNVLDLDTINTSVTNLTTNLINAAYGGTRVAVLTSGGCFGLGTAAPVNIIQAAPPADSQAALTGVNGTSAASLFYFGASVTDITQNVLGMRVELNWNPASNPASNRNIYGQHLSARINSANSQVLTNGTLYALQPNALNTGTGTIAAVYGGFFTAQNTSTGTATIAGALNVQVGNLNAGGTIGTAYGLQIANLVNAGTITTTYGIYIGDITTGTQTNKAWGFYNSDANTDNYFAGSLKIGGTAVRGTTEGTNRLDIFNGTAPVGTLTNGISLYGASGYLKLLDAAGLDGHVLAGSAINTVTPALQNRTITVSVGGTTLYITAKTTND